MTSRPGRRRSGRGSRRLTTALAVGGLALVGTGVVGMLGIVDASAAAAPGSGLGSVDITVSASGVRVPMYSSGGEDVEAQIPWSSASMATGGVTHALTSIFWPGDTGGHGGDTLALLGTPCILENPQGLLPVNPPCVYHPSPPPASVYDALNDPYKAEAQSGRGAPVATAGGQGVSMRAVAHDTDALAQTTMSASQLPVGADTFGETTTKTTVSATGPHTAVIDATSVIHDISLAGGAVTIKAVTSVAHAVSDTVHATGTAATTVSGMKIAGVPVSVDSSGVHVGPQSSSLPGTDQLNAALKQAGVEVYVARPTKTVKGASIALDAGSLLLMEKNTGYTASANDTSRVLILGGASVQAATGKGFDFSLPPLPAPPPPPPAGAGAAGTPGTPGTPGTTGTVSTGAGGVPPVLASPRLAGNSLNLPGGLSPAWVVMVLLGSALVAGAMRRLPASVLAASGAACPIEEGRQ